ncbi:MAG: hypothetical protein AABY22_03600 [Nanoarchaeota archaeon]
MENTKEDAKKFIDGLKAKGNYCFNYESVSEMLCMYANKVIENMKQSNKTNIACDFCLDTYRIQTHDVCERCRKICGD